MSVQSAVKPSLTLKRRLQAPPAKVFAAWTDPEKMKALDRARRSFTTIQAESDARVGGRYRFVMLAPDGEEHDVSGVYRDVVANQKLVFTWAWKARRRRTKSVVTVLLKPDGDGTLLTLTHEQFADEDARDRHQHGWNGSLDKLEKLVA